MHMQTRNPRLTNTFIGFDKFLKAVNEISESSNPNYPPYDIVKLDDTNYRITIAAAGFEVGEIDVTQDGDRLVITGQKSEPEEPCPDYLHKGISTRSFARSFILTENTKPKDARFEHGLLHIDIEHVIPEEKKPRKITIRQN